MGLVDTLVGCVNPYKVGIVAKQVKETKPKKTFSVAGFIGGLIVSYILFSIAGFISSKSGAPLIAFVICSAVITGFAVIEMAQAIKKDDYVVKSATIGMLGLIIGLIAEWVLKGIKNASDPEYKKRLIFAWFITTVWVIAFIILWAVIFG
jgi:chromate transport protein ChrA